jgi:hypothetical protein
MMDKIKKANSEEIKKHIPTIKIASPPPQSIRHTN